MKNDGERRSLLWRYLIAFIALGVLLLITGSIVALLARSVIQEATWKKSAATIVSATLTRPAAPLPGDAAEPRSLSGGGIARKVEKIIELGEKINRLAAYRYTVELADAGRQHFEISLVGIEYKVGDRLQVWFDPDDIQGTLQVLPEHASNQKDTLQMSAVLVLWGMIGLAPLLTMIYLVWRSVTRRRNDLRRASERSH